MPRKTILITIAIVALLAIVGALVYFFFFRTRGEIPPGGGEFPLSEEAGIGEEPESPTVLEETREVGFTPILRQLSATPVAGAVAGGEGENLVVRYIDTATGNVMEIAPTGGEAKRLTNTTIPKVYDALWNKRGNGVILRYLKEDEETNYTK